LNLSNYFYYSNILLSPKQKIVSATLLLLILVFTLLIYIAFLRRRFLFVQKKFFTHKNPDYQLIEFITTGFGLTDMEKARIYEMIKKQNITPPYSVVISKKVFEKYFNSVYDETIKNKLFPFDY